MAREYFAVKFTFSRRPAPLPPDLRPMWRVSILLLILQHCRSHRSSLQRFKDLLAGQLSPSDIIVRYEPALIQAIDFALGGILVRRVGGDKLELTEKGAKLAVKLMEDQWTLSPEKAFLQEVRPQIAENRIRQIVYRRGE